MKLKPQRHKANYKSLALILADIVIVNLAYPIMVLIYWNFRYSPDLMLKLLIRIPFVTLFYIGSYAVSKLYRSVWKYAGIYELFRYAAATAAGTILVWLADYIGMKICRHAGSEILYFNVLPWSIYLDCSLIIICACLAVRLAPRSFKVASAESSRAKRSNTRILILGAGVAGSSLVHEFQQNGYRFGNPVVLVDDDPEKIGRSINGTPIEGGCDRLSQIAQKYNADEIIFCIKNADEKRKRELLEVAVSTGCKVKIVPDINNLPDGGKANYKEIRNVDILDLLSRPEIKLDPETCKYLTGETVLVTGGGGSIGSELCRQIAKYAPKKIIIFDIYENNAYTLKQALDRHYFGSPEIIIRIGSVRDKARLREVFEEFH
ncbi:MAG: polysaccharide biosynthesis protein, partial [Clostridia bacterium]|nr:polysaccharide biosynthesis protein [Clostridia bacterium]